MLSDSRIVRTLAALAIGVPVASGSWFGYLRVSGNFHVVVPGEVYRSAQPSADDILAAHRRHGIRTILNLRGAKPGRDWYENETTVARALGIRVVDFKMRANRALMRGETDRLVALLRELPKPILIHCKAGADRTGLAAALYLALDGKTGTDEAEWQLSARYGHIGIPVFSAAWPMDETWDDAERWYGLQD